MSRSGAPSRVTASVVTASLVTLSVLVSASCGIPIDGAPRAVESRATERPAPTVIAGSGSEIVFVYYIREDALFASSRLLTRSTPKTALRALLHPPTRDEKSLGVISQLAPGTELLSATGSPTLTVNLSEEFDNLVGTARSQAVAQIVYTATGLDGIDDVRFEINGTPVKVFSPVGGDVEKVGPCDFLALLPDAGGGDMRTIGQRRTACNNLARR